jgi:hypothetical protein
VPPESVRSIPPLTSREQEHVRKVRERTGRIRKENARTMFKLPVARFKLPVARLRSKWHNKVVCLTPSLPIGSPAQRNPTLCGNQRANFCFPGCAPAFGFLLSPSFACAAGTAPRTLAH